MSVEVLNQELPIKLEENSPAIEKAITDMVTFVQNITVDNEPAFKTVTSLYRQARDWRKIIEEKRKAATDPFRRQVSAINDKAKSLTDPLARIEEIATMKADGYQKMLEDIKAQEDTKIRQAAEILDLNEELYLPPLEKSIRGEGAIAYTKVEKKFRLIDISKVPAKYLKLDEAAIKQDIKLGIVEIPGLEIYEEKTTQLRSR